VNALNQRDSIFTIFKKKFFMFTLFFQGGPLFMSLLTLILLGVIYAHFTRKIYSKTLSVMALVLGVLGQCIGLYDMFIGIESMGGEVSGALLAGGLKVSMISTIYGLLIYSLHLLLTLFISKQYK